MTSCDEEASHQQLHSNFIADEVKDHDPRYIVCRSDIHLHLGIHLHKTKTAHRYQPMQPQKDICM